MPFSTTNVPLIYIATMKEIKVKQYNLFIMKVEKLENTGNDPVEVTNSKDILVGKKKTISVSHTIINDIILWYSTNKLYVFIWYVSARP